MRLGPSLHLNRRNEVAGVWPLRIPGTETACESSSPARSLRYGPARPPVGVRPGPSIARPSRTDELVALRRSQWVSFEKRNDAADKGIERPDRVPVQILPMVVVPTVATDVAALEEPLQLMQDLHAPRSLNHGEARLDLPAETTRAIPEDRHAEASFAVDEADDPLLETWPFLLIARTSRFVTVHVRKRVVAVSRVRLLAEPRI